jgi:hypothetical protein
MLGIIGSSWRFVDHALKLKLEIKLLDSFQP